MNFPILLTILVISLFFSRRFRLFNNIPFLLKIFISLILLKLVGIDFQGLISQILVLILVIWGLKLMLGIGRNSNRRF